MQNSSGNWTNSLSTGLTSPHFNIRDIYFVDDRNGYLIGDGGQLFKTGISTNFDMLSTANWTNIPIEDKFGITSSNETDVMPQCIAFPSYSNGIIGGSKIVNSSPNENYARLIKDESQLYSTYFWYDKLGRLILSQNTKQRNHNPMQYSYTLYDALGRINQVGQKDENPIADLQVESIFGSTIGSYFNNDAIDDENYLKWINSNSATTRNQVTTTYYDNQQSFLNTTVLTQQNLRNRVASVTYEEVYDGFDATFSNATHYSYDIHGNVNTLLQDNPSLSTIQQQYKRIDYDFDLISGKVNKVSYQQNQLDQFCHKYDYDADNRITKVFTSADGINEDKDAEYFYYPHGPLARTQVGDNQVQGIDYAYTLQGWLKGINSTQLNAQLDMGKDGYTPSSTTNLHQNFALDAFSYSLGYYNNDYTPIGATNNWNTVASRFTASITGSDLEGARYNLYNGNIGSMQTTILPTYTYSNASSVPTALPQGTGYKYDQLNRILSMQAYTNLANNQWGTSGSYNGRYNNTFTYDANGNILTQTRKNDNGTLTDNLTYHYYDDPNGRVQNRLYNVNDAVGTAVANDVGNQGVFNASALTMNAKNNYSYDEIGNLTKDSTEEIKRIDWTVSGKIKKIIRRNSSSKTDLEFEYDASGNRITKIDKPHGSSLENGGSDNTLLWTYTHYVRDAQGNIMATYKQTTSGSLASFKLQEQPMYGSCRLGVRNNDLEMIGATMPTIYFSHNVGLKQYEGANHLGNVLSTFTDRKIPRSIGGSTIDYYTTDVRTATDYYPFGMQMEGRSFSTSNYSFSFNGQLKDNEVKGNGNSVDFGSRIYDPRLGKFLSLDPMLNKFAGESPYSFAGNSPVLFLDKLGETKTTYLTVIDPNGVKMTFKIVDAKKVVEINYGEQVTISGWHGSYIKQYDFVVNLTIDYSNLNKDGTPKTDATSELIDNDFEGGLTALPQSQGAIEVDFSSGEGTDIKDLVGLVGGGEMNAKEMPTTVRGIMSLISNLISTFGSFDKVYEKLGTKIDLSKKSKDAKLDTICKNCHTEGDHKFGTDVINHETGDTISSQDSEDNELKKK